MKTFRKWMEEKGLADFGFVDKGPPKIKNKKLPNRYKIPDIPTYNYERDRGIATKLDPG